MVPSGMSGLLLQHLKHAAAEQPFLWQNVWSWREGDTAFVPAAARLRSQLPRPGPTTQQGHAVLAPVGSLIISASNHDFEASLEGKAWELLPPCPAPCFRVML